LPFFDLIESLGSLLAYLERLLLALVQRVQLVGQSANQKVLQHLGIIALLGFVLLLIATIFYFDRIVPLRHGQKY
jgi:hypothetical protein